MNNEKITEIIKEFREKFPGTIHSELTVAGLTSNWESKQEIEAWLTQTLTLALHDTEQEVRNQDIAVLNKIKYEYGPKDVIMEALVAIKALTH